VLRSLLLFSIEQAGIQWVPSKSLLIISSQLILSSHVVKHGQWFNLLLLLLVLLLLLLLHFFFQIMRGNSATADGLLVVIQNTVEICLLSLLILALVGIRTRDERWVGISFI